MWLLAGDEYDVTTLAKLRAAGIVTARRDGRRQLHRVDDPHIATVIEQMFTHIAPDGTLATRPTPAGHPAVPASPPPVDKFG